MPDLMRFHDNVDKGIDVYPSEFGPVISLTEDSYNLSQGIKHGLGPRYGISPIPFHNIKDGNAGEPAGLRRSEEAAGASFVDRKNFFGVVPVILATYSDISIQKTHFVWLCSVLDTNYYITIGLGSEISGSIFNHKSDIGAGVPPPVYKSIASTTNAFAPAYLNVRKSYNSTETDDLKEATIFDSGKWWLNFDTIKSSGKLNPAVHVVGRKISNGNTNTSASANFSKRYTGAVIDRFGGIIPEFNTRKFKKIERTLVCQNVSTALECTYSYNNKISISALESLYVAVFNADHSTANIVPPSGATRTNRLDGTAPVYASVTDILYIDSEMRIDSSHTAMLIAGKKPISVIFQEWQRNQNGMIQQWFDMRQHSNSPRDTETKLFSSGNPYTEDDTPKKTCWEYWPAFVTGTALGNDSATNYDYVNMLTLGAANSGILRKNTIYEFTFSVYNKQFGYETNVGTPAKIQTGANDYVAMTIFRDPQAPVAPPRVPANRDQISPISSGFKNIVPVFLGTITVLNYCEIRFYYRVAGSFEWLPAGNVDAADYFYNCDIDRRWICNGPIAALPGGQPGGFNDYSTIQDDEYFDVKVFQNRVFWCSKSKLVYSPRNNIFVYPLRNSVACPTGEFRGMAIHRFFGQSEQSSSLLIFGSAAVYQGRFTGRTQDMPIVLSPDVIGNYPVDGSDFEVQDISSNTAYGGRAAVLADGVMFWWGPDGIFAYDGVAPPVSVTRQKLEPWIFDQPAPNKTEDIFGFWQEKTREIIWIYDKKGDTSGLSFGLCFNVDTKEFLPLQYPCKIDSAHPVDISGGVVDRQTAGKRIVISARENSSATVQRGYFHDSRNRAGDFAPENEWLVKSVSSPTSDTRLLTFDSGYNAAKLALVEAGDRVVLQQNADYSEDAAAADLEGIVAATGAGTLTIALPPGSTAFTPAASFAFAKYFPIWIARHNAIPWRLKTGYWIPGGIDGWFYWIYVHLLFKINLLPAKFPPQLNFSYRSPIAADHVTNLMTLADNSDGHCQIYSQLKSHRQSFEGQALRLLLSGDHNGHEWVLQYLGADIKKLDGEYLQHFEG